MPSDAWSAFVSNCADIEQLLSIHSDLGGSNVGRRKLEVLNKSAVVLITSFWEAYCEDLAAEALLYLVTQAKSAKDVPEALQRRVSRDLKKDQHDLSVWKVAGSGWRTHLTGRLETLRAEREFKYSSPKAAQVDNLFAEALGLERISSAWTWNRMSATRAREKLDEYVQLRHAVAHRGAAARSVLRSDVEAYFNHVDRLVDATDAAARTFLLRVLRKAPWPRQS